MFIWGVVGGRCDIIRKKIRMKVEQRDRKLESGGSCWGKNFKNMDFFYVHRTVAMYQTGN